MLSRWDSELRQSLFGFQLPRIDFSKRTTSVRKAFLIEAAKRSQAYQAVCCDTFGYLRKLTGHFNAGHKVSLTVLEILGVALMLGL